MKKIFLLLLSLSVVLAGCKKSDSSSNETSNNKYTVTSTGKAINDTTSGVSIIIPQNATTSTLNITITKLSQIGGNLEFIGGSNYPSIGDEFKIENDAVPNLTAPALVTIPYDSNKVTDVSNLAVAYFSEVAKKWVPVEISGIDTKNHKISFYTTHFSLWSLFVNTSKTYQQDPIFFANLDTKFLPTIDGFPFDNNLPDPYSSPGYIASIFGKKGNCAGFSSLAIMYYAYIRNITGMRLDKYAFRGTNISDYSSVFHGINEASKELNGFSDLLVKLFNTPIAINNTSASSKIYYALKELNVPVFLSLQDANQENGHAVVVYKYDNITDRFYYYNPNLPENDNLFFTNNTDGSLNSFEYSGSTDPNKQIYAQYFRISTVQGGGLSLDKSKNIFDTYFIYPTNSVPVLTTTTTTSITQTSASGGGNITSDGGSAVTVRGVCWSTSSNPTISNNKTTDGTGTGSFTSSITGLSPNTTYHVRAYATNSVGTSYGNDISFPTLQNTLQTAPILTTTPIFGVTSTTALSGGNVTSDGGSTVTARGICWSTSQNPTIADSKTSNGNGAGVYSSTMSGLIANTIYYIRSYATNSFGTSYGNQVSFTTTLNNSTGTVTDIDGNVYHTITIGTQVWMLENLKTTKYRDGSSIPNVQDAIQWYNLTTGAWCNYDNISTSGVAGALYNGYVISDSRGLAPIGWHIPSLEEYKVLTNYLGGDSLAGGHLKDKYSWGYFNDVPPVIADNSSGFTALAVGVRIGANGSASAVFYMKGTISEYWISDNETAQMIWGNSMVRFFYGCMVCGYSVRCIKD